MISRKRAGRALSFDTTAATDASDKTLKKQKSPSFIGTLYSLSAPKYPNIQLDTSKSTITFGRSKKKNNDHIVNEIDCSSSHCQLIISNNGPNDTLIISIKDTSSNGTFINDTLIGKENTLLVRDGDKLSLASNVHYIVKYSNMSKTAAVPSFFDKYILTPTVLGTGHYAQVKETINRETGEICAVKIFHPTTKKNEGDANQLNRELNILTELNHPNVVGFYSTFLEPVNESSITTYLVLEKVNGGELFNRIVNKGKLNQFECKSIMKQLTEGLSYLHSKDIVHRDLKPENILLSITPGVRQSPWDEGESNVVVKIADFGLAKFIGKFQFTNTLCGTPAYVAPEVLVNSQERKYNRAVDMWSVGVLLYVCLCGFPPFSEELGPPTMRQQILEGKYAFYSPYWDDIDDIILDLISRLLVVNPNERLTANQMLIHPWINEGLDVINFDDVNKPQLSFNGIERMHSDINPITLQTKACESVSESNYNADEDGDLSMTSK